MHKEFGRAIHCCIYSVGGSKGTLLNWIYQKNKTYSLSSLDTMNLHANFDDTGLNFLQNIPTDSFDWTLNTVKKKSAGMHVITLLSMHVAPGIRFITSYSETRLIRHALREKVCVGIDRVSGYTVTHLTLHAIPCHTIPYHPLNK